MIGRAFAGCCLAAALVVAGAGCGDAGEPAGRPDPADLTVPDPELSAMEPALAEWLRERRETVAREADDPDRPPEEVARDFGELGELYFVFDFLDAAVTTFDHARRLAPEEHRWVYLHGHALRDRGDLDEAAASFERALELRPDSLATLLYAGEVELERGRPESAERHYRRALEIDPDAAAAHYGMGRIRAETGEPEAAVTSFRRALALAPQASTIHYQLAQAYRELGRTQEAESHLARRGNDRVPIPDDIGQVLRDLKTLTAYQVVLARAREASADEDPERLLDFFLTQLGDVEGTLEQLEGDLSRGAQGNGDGAMPALQRARLHYLAGGLATYRRQDDRALRHFQRAVELEPGLLDAQVKLGNALARSGRFEEAARRFATVLEARPGDRDVAVKRATALLNLGRGQEALAELEDLARQAPDDVLLRIRIAEALEAMGRVEAAEARHRQNRGLSLPPAELTRAAKAYGDFLSRRQRFAEALAAYEDAIRLYGDNGAARRDLAALLGRLGRFGEAAEAYAEAAARQPDDEAARLGEAAALFLSGRLAEAKGRLGEGVARLPQSAVLHHLLGRLLAAAPDASLRDGDRAVEAAQRAFDLDASPVHAETLAMAYAERGQFETAAGWQQRALEGLAADAPGRDEAFARLTLYRGGRPYRAPDGSALLP